MKSKKIAWLAASSALFLAFGGLMTGCGETGTDRSPSGEDGGDVAGNEVGTYRGLESVESVYAVGAVTTAKLLSFSFAESNASLAAAAGETGGDFGLPETVDALTEVQAGAEDFNKYFNMLDSFLNKQELTTVVTQNTAEGELGQYAYKAVITGKNAANEDVSHTLYYNETLTRNDTRTEHDDGETKTVTEKVYTLSGVVEMDGTYYMSGTHTLRAETEEDETEKSETLRIRASATAGDTQDYVELLHESETEEEWGETEQEAKYVYTTYSAGGRVEQTEIEFEQENEHGQTETEYGIVFTSGASRRSYEVERVNVNGKTYIEVEYLVNGTRGKFVILKNADGTYRYKFTSRDADDRTFRDFDD